MTGPNLTGFADAQHRLREAFGEPIDFFWPASVTFPPGTPADPETGKPYDPALVPTSSGQASATVTCNVSFTARQDEEAGAMGFEDKSHVMLIADYDARAVVEGAHEFRARDEIFKVTAMKQDGVGDPRQRWLVYGRRKG